MLLEGNALSVCARASLMVQLVSDQPVMQETPV